MAPEAQAPCIAECQVKLFRATFCNTITRLIILADIQNITMSRASQITLATTCVTAIGIVAFVHYGQKAEKAASFQSHHHKLQF